MIKIDAVDKQISDLLLEDGRMSCAKIASRIGGISERAVRYRINRLIENHVISIRGNVNAEALGLNVCADVFIEVEPASVLEIAKKLAEYEVVSYIAYSTGDTDISIQVFAHNNSELFSFVTEVVGKIPGVRKTHISFVPIKIKDDHVWTIPSSVIVKEE
ncbi:MAG TPA: Lrp/AsnC family transcriptional regulator [Anaerolineaceae bacterium]|nr:Lrp/AsnC family transcriptional regulator [Anaerolineaceae bacterium]HOV06092.1 Lrp/AsnC family transcriptional regulator [Anaerolineaceae bacterium]